MNLSDILRLHWQNVIKNEYEYRDSSALIYEGNVEVKEGYISGV